MADIFKVPFTTEEQIDKDTFCRTKEMFVSLTGDLENCKVVATDGTRSWHGFVNRDKVTMNMDKDGSDVENAGSILALARQWFAGGINGAAFRFHLHHKDKSIWTLQITEEITEGGVVEKFAVVDLEVTEYLKDNARGIVQVLTDCVNELEARAQACANANEKLSSLQKSYNLLKKKSEDQANSWENDRNVMISNFVKILNAKKEAAHDGPSDDMEAEDDADSRNDEEEKYFKEDVSDGDDDMCQRSKGEKIKRGRKTCSDLTVQKRVKCAPHDEQSMHPEQEGQDHRMIFRKVPSRSRPNSHSWRYHVQIKDLDSKDSDSNERTFVASFSNLPPWAASGISPKVQEWVDKRQGTRFVITKKTDSKDHEKESYRFIIGGESADAKQESTSGNAHTSAEASTTGDYFGWLAD